MSANIDEPGPVDRELVRVLDLIFLIRDVEGGFEVFEASDRRTARSVTCEPRRRSWRCR